MKARHRAWGTLPWIAILATGAAAATTNYADQWWNPDESGWGVSIEQQADVLFVGLAVYGPDRQPLWLVASATLQPGVTAGRDVFAGDLYQTSGSWFGAAWNPAALRERRVGSLTFEATGTDTATLSYTVDGTPAAKALTRQTWAHENLGGVYQGGWSATCGDVWWPWVDSPIRLEIVHRSDDSVDLRLRHTEPDMQFLDPLLMTGRYRQSGHVGRIDAEVTRGGSGSITFFEIEKTASGFTGRMQGTITLGMVCPLEGGRIGMGVR